MDDRTPDSPPIPTAVVVDAVVRARRTTKVEVDAPAPVPGAFSRAVVGEVLATAGFAPFHHAAPPEHGGPIEPWRCYLLDAPACRWLCGLALAEGVVGRIPRLLGAASALAAVTWLPEGPSEPGPRPQFEGTLTNMEHVAAVGAMVQTALVAAAARGIPTYWSSGRWIGTAGGLRTLGVPAGQLLLGAVFFFPPSIEGADIAQGKHRDRRSPVGAWARWVEPPPGPEAAGA